MAWSFSLFKPQEKSYTRQGAMRTAYVQTCTLDWQKKWRLAQVAPQQALRGYPFVRGTNKAGQVERGSGPQLAAGILDVSNCEFPTAAYPTADQTFQRLSA